jgi:hypothetical protein
MDEAPVRKSLRADSTAWAAAWGKKAGTGSRPKSVYRIMAEEPEQ